MKSKIVLFVCLVGMMFSGCASITEPVIQTLANKRLPPDGRYEILGEVRCDGSRFNVLGVIWWGEGIRYLDLLKTAREEYKYGAVDNVVNITVDRDIISVLGIFTSEYIMMHGIAIRYTDGAAAGPKSAGTPAVE